ncbi:NADP-dependent oxidoreductase domain-containing protein [Lophiotrema nucula]|uniref:NADP-dependent oxidoreductase domain-containing protein n=1 Tax=Lophiotrema nucula TaxID=690887 RepID=A0A6A5ZAH7_9PLEO|nr:NADP-dependent oxidoreductase domain-containing protein [Lophiotrema nucula]
MALQRTFKLNSGYAIPAIGLGTWQSAPNEVEAAVIEALKVGYRHIDAAAIYGNEAEVGRGIKKSGVPRSEIFITGKLWNTDHEPCRVEAAVDETLRDLQTDYLDLFLIHWPVPLRYTPDKSQPVNAETGLIDVIDVPDEVTWAAMEELVSKGKVRSIGVSNFTRERIEHISKTAKIVPAVNQIEAHPYLQQRDLLSWAQENGIVIAGYSPLGNNIYSIPRAVDDPVVVETAKALGKSPAQLLISWAVQRGTVVLPKSVTASRIADNFEDFEVPKWAFEKIYNLEKHMRMNFPARIGIDIFGEVGEESAKQSARDWAEAQKKLQATA